jgi:hypothetical protein
MTTEYPNVEITLPLSLDALVAAESQVDVLLEKLGAGRDEELAFALRVIVNEGFRNALVIQPQEGHLKVMRMTLSAGPKGVEVLLREPGRGFAIEGCLPPYPGEHIGRECAGFSRDGRTAVCADSRPSSHRIPRGRAFRRTCGSKPPAG